MRVLMDIVCDITNEDGGGGGVHRNVTIEPTFYTGNRRAAVAFIKSMDGDEVKDEILLQVNGEGKLTIARKRDDGATAGQPDNAGV